MRRSTAGCGPHSPTSGCATPPRRSPPRPACRVANSIAGPSLSGARKDEASQAEYHPPPPTCATPRAGGGVALPLAPSAAWLAYPGARLALPGRRDRYFGAPRQRRRIARAAEAFLLQRSDLASLDLRFDLMLVAPLRLPRHWRGAWRADD